MESSSLTMLGKYEIRGRLGRGAMGIVYDGWDPLIDRRVAIKTVRLPDVEDAEAIDALGRFKREAQAAGRLSHPNIVGVYDYGQTVEMTGGDIAYIVMEFIEGQSLKALLDAEERFPVGETARIMQELLAGLQFSHTRGVIHRDIKPANVMVTIDGQVKIADFGIARIESSSLTQAGTVMGTPAYMSPEQFMGQTVDARTDVYSSGVLLYQMLTGERPFEGSMTAIMHKVLNTTPPRPSELSVVAPPGIDPVVGRAMARRPEDRFASAAEFAQALRRAAETPAAVSLLADPAPVPSADATIIASAPPGPARLRPSGETQPATPPRRSSPMLLGGVAVAALLVAAGGSWFALRPSVTPEPTPATVTQPVAHATPTEPESAARATLATPERQASLSEPPASNAAPPPASPPPAAPTPVAATPPPPEQAAPAQVAVSQSAPPSPSVARASPIPASPTHASPTPASPAPASQPKVAFALPNPSAIRQALAEVGRTARCALPRFSVSGEGQVAVAGPVGAGNPEATLRKAVEDAAPRAPITWRTRGFDGPYCAALDMVRPIAQPSSPFLGLGLKDEATILKDHQPIVPMLRLPEFPAHLIVDYLSHDGSVTHLFPTPADHDKTFAANAAVTLGEPGKGVGEVGPPFGTDMIVAVASSVPLFAQRRPTAGETVETYLPALRGAIDAALQRDAKVVGRAIVLDTVEH